MSAMLPSVFVSHGSPMHALQAGPAGEAWKALAQRLPRPRAILIRKGKCLEIAGSQQCVRVQGGIVRQFGNRYMRQHLSDETPFYRVIIQEDHPSSIFRFPQIRPGLRNIFNCIGVHHDRIGSGKIRDAVLVPWVKILIHPA